jgi:hypothetical protein
MAYFLSLKILTRHFCQKHLIHSISENWILASNPKTHPKWVKTCNFDRKLMQFWLKNDIYTPEVGLFFNPFFFIDLAAWNPGII